MPIAITQRDRITASANLDISEMDGVVQVKSRPSETSGFSYARPRYRNPKIWPKKLFGNRLCSKNVVWPWKPNKIRIFVSSPIIGSNWKDIYLFIYLPFHLFVYFIIDYVVFFFWLLLLISSQWQRWKSFTSFRSERLFLFSVQCCKIKTKAISTANRSKGSIMRNQWELEVKIRNLPEVWETRVTKLWLVLVLNLIGRESGANFLDQSKREVKQEQIIFGESYTFKTICSWWWSTTINFYNGFLLFLPFSWSMSTPHSS